MNVGVSTAVDASLCAVGIRVVNRSNVPRVSALAVSDDADIRLQKAARNHRLRYRNPVFLQTEQT